MDGFKNTTKMKYFKEGGQVSSKPKSIVEKTIKVASTGDKKANAKAAAVAPKDKEAKVDISTMKKSGRTKKAVGTVKKFADGGMPGTPIPNSAPTPGVEPPSNYAGPIPPNTVGTLPKSGVTPPPPPVRPAPPPPPVRPAPPPPVRPAPPKTVPPPDIIAMKAAQRKVAQERNAGSKIPSPRSVSTQRFKTGKKVGK